MADDFGNSKAVDPVQSCPLVKPVHWLEIQLIGEDDGPIPFEEYLVVLSDGKNAKGYTDGDGRARFDGIRSPGTCKVSFPNLDKDAWEFVRTE